MDNEHAIFKGIVDEIKRPFQKELIFVFTNCLFKK